MYRIESADYGYKITFIGKIKANEMARWVRESNRMLSKRDTGFCVFWDMRDMETLSASAMENLHTGQELYRKRGMDRSVAVYGDTGLAGKFKRIALDTGNYDRERHIDTTIRSDWELSGLDWVTMGIDPDIEEYEETLTPT